MSDQPSPQQLPAAAQGKRNRPSRKQHNYHNSIPQLDRAVSDSVTNASPRSKKPPRQQHQQKQAVASGVGHAQNGHMANANGNEKARPASMGGPMLAHTTPGKEKAYAGPTFQASPAASKLPMPSKFFSRSVPNAAPPGSMQARLEGEKTPEETSSPEQDTVSPSRVRPDAGLASPLDMFFNADKAEKQKRTSATLSPASAASRRPTEQKSPLQSERSVFMQGFDDQPMLGPKTAQNQRPQAGERAHSSPGIAPQSNGDFGASTQALKDMLFKNMNSPPPASTPPREQRPQSSGSGSESPSPFQRPGSGSGPSTPDPQQNYHYGNRNLSPMFQAARAETPTRPSNLRQQYGQSPPQQFPQYGQSPDDFSRSYLDQHIRTSMSSQPPPELIPNGIHTPSGSFPGPPHRPNSGNSTNSAPGPRQGGSRDVQDMSNDLRRMLNLNALG